MSKCELCKNTARVYCESDEARLCWSCDARVHSANFLVARHVRNLLCHSCQSPTPWNGSGNKLGRTLSLCQPCVVRNCAEKVESAGEREASSESGTDFDSDDDEDENSIEEEEEDSHNQVVPLSSFTSPSSPPMVSSSGTQGPADINTAIKRSYEYGADLKSKDDGDSSCIAGEGNSYVEKNSSLRPFKFRKLQVNQTSRPQGTSPGSRIGEPARRIQHHVGMAEPISGVDAFECVDFDLNECPFDQHK